ncbi:hypothetical protein JAAARDRAFT_50599 [Jaapia argillacea MUCL 33604]|uniref:Uncharacterized protein n=1 Tax=Jaapia argillacea MUCL 33604 TaxID=933084 RepID=A0A067PD81_9AGAM|nr:hypothetical protein JAAARDRAFT_50599 [Jaapia argillacea MUCL 33604]
MESRAHHPPEAMLCFKTEPLNYGDVCLTYGSIKLPIVKLLNGSRSTVTDCSRQTQRSLEADFTKNKLRPSIIGESRPLDAAADWRPMVWYMATFGDVPPSTLPRLYQHFLLAVNSPHHPGVIHTSPQWESDSRQWVLALGYTPPTCFPESQRFTTTHDVERNSSTEYSVSGDMMHLIEGHSRVKVLQWSELGKQKQDQMRAQFNRHVAHQAQKLNVCYRLMPPLSFRPNLEISGNLFQA